MKYYLISKDDEAETSHLLNPNIIITLAAIILCIILSISGLYQSFMYERLTKEMMLTLDRSGKIAERITLIQERQLNELIKFFNIKEESLKRNE